MLDIGCRGRARPYPKGNLGSSQSPIEHGNRQGTIPTKRDREDDIIEAGVGKGAEWMATVTWNLEEVGEKGMAIYRESIRPQLTEADKGKYVYIHTGNGEWLMGEDDWETSRRAIAKWGYGQPILSIRAGYR